jgi:hypothetical protein
VKTNVTLQTDIPRLDSARIRSERQLELHLEHGESVLGVVVGNGLDQAAEGFGHSWQEARTGGQARELYGIANRTTTATGTMPHMGCLICWAGVIG